MKRLSRFNKVLITVGVVAASGGVSLGITSLVSANNSVQSEVASINGTGTITGDLSVASADDAIAASGDVSVASDGSTASAETKVMHTGGPGPHSEAMAELFGMTVDELHDALHSGKSLATIAEEKNVALSKVTDLLVAELSAHLDEEVASGEHTREEADAKLAKFKANVDTLVTTTPPARGEGHRGGKGHGPRIGARSEALAELFGMTVDELHDALHSGKSLATIAEEKNVALSKVTDLLVAELSAHLDEEVAAGELTREQADAKLAKFKANVDEMVTKTRPTRGEGGPHGEMGPRGGRHGGGHRGFSSHETPRELGELEGSGTAFV